MYFYSEYDPSTAETMQSLLSGFQGLSSALSLVLGVFSIICLWKLFTKGGEKGWKALIPLYNLYTEYKLCWKTKKFWTCMILTILCSVATGVGTVMMVMGVNEAGVLVNFTSALIGLLLMILGIGLMVAVLVNSIRLLIRMAKAYGQEGAFAVGLIFLPLIFMAILAFGSSQYEGPQA